jgi:hypothetical protein
MGIRRRPSFRLTIFALILIVNLVAPTVHSNAAINGLANDQYGLYYADWDKDEASASLVISPDGKPIPPKANDPDAPTQPGFYLHNQRYAFASLKLSASEAAFTTKEMNALRFSFKGRFGREGVESIENVPYLEGTIAQTDSAGRTQTRKIHFGHAVIL